MKEVTLSTDGKYLILEEIRFKRPKPLSTIEVKVSTANSPPIRIDIKEDFVDAIKNFPDANAYLNLGSIPEKSKAERITFSDNSKGTAYWDFYKVELYHLGE